MNLRDLFASAVRTGVPLVIFAVLRWVTVKTGVEIPVEPSSTIIAGVAVGAYYVAVRWAEARWRWVGWLLGFAAAPNYSKAPVS